MSSAFIVPKESSVTETLSMLYGDGLEVTAAAPLEPSADHLVAVFVADDDTPVAAGVCDIAFAAYAGSALSRIPAGGASDAVQSGKLSEAMMDNVREVMNIFSRLFMSNDTPHLRLDAVYATDKDLPDNARDMLSAPLGRADCEVKVPNYGSGCLSLITT